MSEMEDAVAKDDDALSTELVTKLKELVLCTPDCHLNAKNLSAPMVPCGLCERWFHFQCVGIPEGTPRSIRGLYFCQDCLTIIRYRCLQATEFNRSDIERRLAAMEATIQALEVEQAALRESLAGSKLGMESVTRVGGRVIDASYAALMLENARLMRRLADITEKVPAANKKAIDILSETKIDCRRENFDLVSKVQTAVQTDIYEKLLDWKKNVTLELAPKTTCGIANVFTKRKIMSTSRYSYLHPKDDHFIKCEDCGKEYYDKCQIHGPMLRIPDSVVADDDPQKAKNSVPAGLDVRVSSLPGAGLGVFVEDDEGFGKGTVFGPYKGVIKSIEDATGEYCWQIVRKKNMLVCIDGKDNANSNWMKYVNCANDYDSQNLTAFQYKGHIFYRAIKNIYQGEELLIWYGREYAQTQSSKITNLKSSSAEKSEKHVPAKRAKLDVATAGSILSDESGEPSNLNNLAYKSADGQYKCLSCDFMVRTPLQLRQHELTEHKIPSNQPCHGCQRHFSNVAENDDHSLSFPGSQNQDETSCLPPPNLSGESDDASVTVSTCQDQNIPHHTQQPFPGSDFESTCKQRSSNLLPENFPIGGDKTVPTEPVYENHSLVVENSDDPTFHGSPLRRRRGRPPVKRNTKKTTTI